jgi:N-acetylglutamate synthase-like GNAT family acetyltransferase
MIRKATPFDMPALVALMRGYVAEAPMEVLKDEAMHDQPYIEALLASLMAGRGFILIDDRGRGFIAAVINSNVWCPSLMELHELAWWVQPEHRGGTLGGRLWKAFDLLAQDYLDCGRAQIVCSSVIANSPKINYTKRGYRLMQTTYFKEL